MTEKTKVDLVVERLNEATQQLAALTAERDGLKAEAEAYGNASTYWYVKCLEDRGQKVDPYSSSKLKDEAVREAVRDRQALTARATAAEAERDRLRVALERAVVPKPIMENHKRLWDDLPHMATAAAIFMRIMDWRRGDKTSSWEDWKTEPQSPSADVLAEQIALYATELRDNVEGTAVSSGRIKVHRWAPKVYEVSVILGYLNDAALTTPSVGGGESH